MSIVYEAFFTKKLQKSRFFLFFALTSTEVYGSNALNWELITQRRKVRKGKSKKFLCELCTLCVSASLRD